MANKELDNLELEVFKDVCATTTILKGLRHLTKEVSKRARVLKNNSPIANATDQYDRYMLLDKKIKNVIDMLESKPYE